MKILKQAVENEVSAALAGAGAEGELANLLGPATVEEHGDLAVPCPVSYTHLTLPTKA